VQQEEALELEAGGLLQKRNRPRVLRQSTDALRRRARHGAGAPGATPAARVGRQLRLWEQAPVGAAAAVAVTALVVAAGALVSGRHGLAASPAAAVVLGAYPAAPVQTMCRRMRRQR
jgi:hypothetical protein